MSKESHAQQEQICVDCGKSWIPRQLSRSQSCPSCCRTYPESKAQRAAEFCDAVEDDNDTDNLIVSLADLLHYARVKDIDLDACLRQAKTLFAQEIYDMTETSPRDE